MTDQVSTQLQRIQNELGEIVEARIQALESVLQNAEKMTRRLIKAEMELEHLNNNESELSVQAGNLENQVTMARARNYEIETIHKKLVEEREQLRSRQEQLFSESSTLRGQVEEIRQQVGEVEDEANTLRTENTNLRTKAKALQENLTRMRQLRDELMSSISGLTQQMSGLAGSEPE
ncbi:MAG: hypothetical protein H8D71_00400, partial [Deltaproteobacteria bacterium]|nr:hypothetical protein [Deltaproteobacteria bacterium]